MYRDHHYRFQSQGREVYQKHRYRLQAQEPVRNRELSHYHSQRQVPHRHHRSETHHYSSHRHL